MGALADLGFIKDATAFPCVTPDPLLIMEAGANAIAPVLLEAVTFGCRDIVKMRAGISPWHARGMRAMIGGAIPAEQTEFGSPLLKFTIPIEKALFFFFVVDLTIEFFARWQSLIFQMNACGNNPNDCEAHGRRPFWINYPPGQWYPVEYLDTQQNGNCHFSLRSQVIVNQGCFWSLFFDLTTQPIVAGQPVGSLSTRIVKIFPQRFEFPAHEHAPAWFGNTVSGSHMGKGQNKFNGFEIFEMQAKADAPAISVVGTVAFSSSNLPLHDNTIKGLSCLGKEA